MASNQSEKSRGQDAVQAWDQNRGTIHSSKGGWIIGRGVLNQGYEMMEDFVGKRSYMQVHIFNVTGRHASRGLADWIEAVCICLSWPDARIWCNNIGALGGTSRASAIASTAAGVMGTESRMYGIRPVVEGVEFISNALRLNNDGYDVSAILEKLGTWRKGKPYMMGYARPIAKGDERVPVLEETRESLGLSKGPHLSLAFDINRHLQFHYGESININGYVTALMADNSYTGEELYHILVTAVASGVITCFIDTQTKPQGMFMAQRCNDLIYQGTSKRTVPEGKL